MSRKISQVFQESYDAEVKRAYGQKRLLAGTCREKTITDAKEVFFRKKGKGFATLHNPGADRSAMNIDYTQVRCPVKDWEALDFIDKFDGYKMNFNEASEAAEVCSDALGLRMDQILIDALKDGYNSASMKVGATRTALTVATLLSAIEKLDDNGIDPQNRTCLISAKMKKDLLNTTQMTSSDYNSVKALVNGEVNSFLGLNFIMIASNRKEGGLPQGTTANDKLGFIYNKDAVGFAYGQNVQTFMDYSADKGGYWVGGDFSAGAVVIDDEGVVAIEAGA